MEDLLSNMIFTETEVIWPKKLYKREKMLEEFNVITSIFTTLLRTFREHLSNLRKNTLEFLKYLEPYKNATITVKEEELITKTFHELVLSAYNVEFYKQFFKEQNPIYTEVRNDIMSQMVRFIQFVKKREELHLEQQGNAELLNKIFIYALKEVDNQYREIIKFITTTTTRYQDEFKDPLIKLSKSDRVKVFLGQKQLKITIMREGKARITFVSIPSLVSFIEGTEQIFFQDIVDPFEKVFFTLRRNIEKEWEF